MLKKCCVLYQLFLNIHVCTPIAEHSAAAFERAAWIQPDREVIQRSTVQIEVSTSVLGLSSLLGFFFVWLWAGW